VVLEALRRRREVHSTSGTSTAVVRLSLQKLRLVSKHKLVRLERWTLHAPEVLCSGRGCLNCCEQPTVNNQLCSSWGNRRQR
jgi:hypothetical protein